MSEQLLEQMSDDNEAQIGAASAIENFRKSSRSPRLAQSSGESPIAVAIPLIRDSRPQIAAWPAPPTYNHALNNQPPRSINLATPIVKSTSQMSPKASSYSVGSQMDFSSDSTSNLINPYKLQPSPSHSDRFEIPLRENELKRKIQTLEETVAEYERQKFNVMGTFSEYRERVAERERKLEAEYSGKIIALSEEVLGAKKDFETRMKNFQTLQAKFEREKEQALEKLRREHQKEIQLLEQKFSESQLLSLKQKYIIEIQRLEEERKSLRTEKERLGETFEMKLRRAQSLYETELSAAKMLYAKELEALKDHEEALREEFMARQDEFRDRLLEHQHNSKKTREELVNCKNDLSLLEKKVETKEAEVQAISRELDEAKRETHTSLKRLQSVVVESSELKAQIWKQQEELKKKSELLNVVEAARYQLNQMIRDLQSEVKALKNKVEFLERERDSLQSETESQVQMQTSQVNALEAVLESVTSDKEHTKEHYETLLTKEKQQAEARELAMKKEFSSKLNELEEQYTCLKEDLEQAARIDQDELRESAQQQIHALRTEKELLQAELLALKIKYLDTPTNSEDDMASLLSEIIEKTSVLARTLDEYRDTANSKDEELRHMRKQFDQDGKMFAVSSNDDEEDKDIAVLLCAANQKVQDLEKENEELHSEIERLKKIPKCSSPIMTDEQSPERDMEVKSEVIIQLKNETQTEKNKHLEDLQTEKDRRMALEEELHHIKIDNEEKTSNIEKLHEKVQSLMDQLNIIKEEIDQKDAEIREIRENTNDYNKAKKTIFENKTSSNSEHEVNLNSQIIQEKDSIIKEKQELIDDLNARLTMLQAVEETVKLGDMQHSEAPTMVDCSTDMKDDSQTSVHKPDSDDEDDEHDNDETTDKICCEIQTDDNEDSIDQQEMKDRIEELLHILQQKDDEILQLRDLIPDSELDIPRKKDRSQSISSSGMFQQLQSGRSKKDVDYKDKLFKRPQEKVRPSSPVSRSRFSNLDTTNSGSTRSILNSSSMERQERRGSPSRLSMARRKEQKEYPTSSVPWDKRPAWKF